MAKVECKQQLTPGSKLALFAAKIEIQNIREDNEAYEREVESYRREGLSPHYCRHGMNRWVDYDMICPGCEDGISDYQIALELGKARVHRYDLALRAAQHLTDAGLSTKADEVRKEAVEILFSQREAEREALKNERRRRLQALRSAGVIR